MSVVVLQTRNFALKQADPQEYLFFLILLVVIVAFIIIGNIMDKKGAQKKKTRTNYNKFLARRTASNLGMSQGHIKLMEELVKKAGIAHPMLLYSNRKMLDSFLKKGIFLLEKDSSLTDLERDKRVKMVYEIKEIIDNHSRKTMGLRSTHLLQKDQLLVIATGEGHRFQSRVLNTLNNTITCSFPVPVDGKPLNLKKGTKLKVFFWRDNDSGYSFFTRVTGTDSSSQYAHFYINHANKLSPEQNRKYARKPIQSSCYFYPVELLGIDKQAKKHRINVDFSSRFLGNMKDISARGCRIGGRYLMKKGQLVKVEFDTPLGDTVAAIGRVCNISTKTGDGTTMSVCFKKISNRNRNKIYSYIFNYV